VLIPFLFSPVSEIRDKVISEMNLLVQ